MPCPTDALPTKPAKVGDTFSYAGAPYIIHSIWRRKEGAQWDLAGIKRTDTGKAGTWSLQAVEMVLGNPDYYK